MNCDEFQQQFQRWLDRRVESPDGKMQKHADQCQSCQHQLQLWQAIETSLTTTGTNKANRGPVKRKQIPVGTIAALAVSACLVMALVLPGTNDPIADSRPLTSVDTPSTRLPLIHSNFTDPSTGSQLHPGDWWNQIRDRDWVSRTMPTVRIVRDGVAPLGRSIQRAATLLTTASREQTS